MRAEAASLAERETRLEYRTPARWSERRNGQAGRRQDCMYLGDPCPSTAACATNTDTCCR